MANNSVSRFGLTDNVACGLGNIILHEFTYYQNHQSPYFRDFMRSINTVAGLSYTAILSDDDSILLATYQQYLNKFLLHRARDRRILSNESCMHMAQSVPHMIQLAFIAFRSLEFPDYFETFRKQILKLMGRLEIHDPSGYWEETAQEIEEFFTKNHSAR